MGGWVSLVTQVTDRQHPCQASNCAKHTRIMQIKQRWVGWKVGVWAAVPLFSELVQTPKHASTRSIGCKSADTPPYFDRAQRSARETLLLQQNLKSSVRPHCPLYTRPVTASPQPNKCHCNCHRCLQRVSSTNRSMQGHMLLLLAALLALSVPAGAQTAEGTSGGRKYPSFDGSRNNGENPAWG